MTAFNAATFTLLPPPPLTINPCAAPPACAAQFRNQTQAQVNDYLTCVLQTCTDYNTCHQRLSNALQQHSIQAGQCSVAYNPNYGNYPPIYYQPPFNTF